jgi:hypothetical protein
MQPNLREVTREFGRGSVSLETLRAAAHAEHGDRGLAGEVLRLISEWESRGLTQNDRFRGELRMRVKQLVPVDAPPPAGSTNRRPAGESLYDAGLRGQRRRG